MARRTLILLLVLLGVLASACQGAGNPGRGLTIREPIGSPSSDKSLVIGMVGTLSGSDAWRGGDAFEGANLGVSVANRASSRGSPRFELVTLDDHGNSDRAEALVRRLVSEPRVVGIVYAGPASGLVAARPALHRAGIPGIACFADLADSNELRPPLFQLSAPYSWEAQRLAHYAFTDRGYSKIGLIAEEGSEGSSAGSALRKWTEKIGGRITATRFGPNGDPDAALRRLRARGAEAVVFQGSPSEAARTIRTLHTMHAGYEGTSQARISGAGAISRLRRTAGGHWKPQLLGFDGLISPRAAGAPSGTIAAAPYNRNVEYIPLSQARRFEVGFERWWGDPPYGGQSVAFDAVRVIQRAVSNEGVGSGSPTPDRAGVAGAVDALSGVDSSGVSLSFSGHDRTGLDRASIGLWTVPGRHDRYAGTPPARLDWVPLSRGFAGPGGRTRLPSFTWTKLFKRSALNGTRPPRVSDLRFGVATARTDPLH